jgi:ribosomal protein S18 acetylase RimI-like enzyme
VNPNVIIREARREDLPRIIDLLAEDQLGEHRERVTEPLDQRYVAAFEAIQQDSRTHLLVLEVVGRIAGTLQLNFLPGLSHLGTERAQIEAVRIAGDLRGQGLGHLLMEHAVALAREHGCRIVQLTSNLERADARRFYESLGFVHSHAGMKLTLRNS